MDDPEIILDGKKFKFIKRSRRGDVAVYSSGDLYARVGDHSNIERILASHKKFEQFGFPVPGIVGHGKISIGSYYVEESLGDAIFSYLFRNDMKTYGFVSDELFEKFITITEKFARAQIRSAADAAETSSLFELVAPNKLVEELPEFAEKIIKKYEEAAHTVKIFPLVLTHGDFCSHNLFPSGVIDFEQQYYCPLGYDIVANIFQNGFFPDTTEYEKYKYYTITPKQIARYYQRLDTLFIEMKLQPLSKYKSHFEYLKAIWATRGNHAAPKLQQWRYDLFKKEYLL